MAQQQQSFIKNQQGNGLKIEKFLMPTSIITSALIIAIAFMVSANAIVKNMVTKTDLNSAIAKIGTGTGNNAVAATPAVTVSQDQIKGLFDNKGNITFGDSSRKVLFVEFSDPSCPFCHASAGKNPELVLEAAAEDPKWTQFKVASQGGTYVPPVPEMKKMVDEGKASYTWIYTTGHKNGRLGTHALYCAHEKGKFWEVHDFLMTYKGYNVLNNEVINDKANSGKLADYLKDYVDPAFMKSCLESGKYDQKIQADDSSSSSFGVSGTPGYFVNTTAFSGAYSFEDMKSTVDSALNS